MRKGKKRKWSYTVGLLTFSREALEGGKGRPAVPFLYMVSEDSLGTPRMAVALIPQGEQARNEMLAWILPRRPDSLGQVQTRVAPATSDPRGDCDWEPINNGALILMPVDRNTDWTQNEPPIYDYVCTPPDDRIDDPTMYNYLYNWPDSGGGGGSSYPYNNGSDDSDDDQDPPPMCDPDSPINPVRCVYADGAGADAFENRIIDSDLAPCMMDEMNTLLTVNKGVGEIIHDFAIDQLNPDPMLGNLNWNVRDGDLPVNVYGETYDYDGVTHTAFTKFDTDKFNNATEIAVAQTMLHEAVHAYLTAYFYSNNAAFQKTYAELFEMYIEKNNIEASQHAYMATNFVGQIAEALQGFGNYYGLNIDYQYYHDLAWGGLQQTTYFKDLNPLVKQRIKTRLSTELTGHNMAGQKKTPKGKPSGC